MKFLVDAQLPRRLVYGLRNAGHDALHTLDLPNSNHTTDAELIALASADGRVVVSKDRDFASSFILFHRPRKLLLVSTGNLPNKILEQTLFPNLSIITTALETCDFVELTRTLIIVHIADTEVVSRS
jgi:predicted nuclease of predicted toxin-antitoxin system